MRGWDDLVLLLGGTTKKEGIDTTSWIEEGEGGGTNEETGRWCTTVGEKSTKRGRGNDEVEVDEWVG